MGKKLANKVRQPPNNISLFAELTNTILTTTLLIDPITQKRDLSGSISQPDLTLKKMKDFLDALFSDKRRLIIYFLTKNEVCYQNALRKTFPPLRNKLTIDNNLCALREAGIIEIVPHEDYIKTKEINHLSAHKKAFRIPDKHFNEIIVFYRLTPLANTYYGSIDFDTVIDEKSKNDVAHYRNKLEEIKHKEIVRKEEEKEKRKIEKKDYNQYDKPASDLISLLQAQLISAMGDRYDSHREEWAKLRRKIKTLYIAKLRGSQWKEMVKNTCGDDSDIVIFCIEKQMIPIDLIKKRWKVV